MSVADQVDTCNDVCKLKTQGVCGFESCIIQNFNTIGETASHTRFRA